ncbi:hypothetical protein F2P81_006541 [Scophthalmus maximus]|uniref:Uncharacterized protein n=1 Tax=Scophthalmus maximus TaxID=52904 RepID=A0A6A4T3F3_SCOMX|nr:hypothetical protein F2P81_006541 [Scophthalmus maximus]
MASQTQPDTGSGGGEEVVVVEEEEEGVCQRGCGLVVSAGEEHCCVDALRSVTDALEERSAALEHDARMARLRWNRREQSLLAQVSALQDEARLAALRYQRRLHQYTLRVSGVAERIVGHCKNSLTCCVKRHFLFPPVTTVFAKSTRPEIFVITPFDLISRLYSSPYSEFRSVGPQCSCWSRVSMFTAPVSVPDVHLVVSAQTTTESLIASDSINILQIGFGFAAVSPH